MVALFTTEAEILSLCSAICKIIHQIKILKDFGIIIDQSVIVHEDSQGGIKIKKNSLNNTRCKYLSIRVDFILDYIEKGVVDIRYIKNKS